LGEKTTAKKSRLAAEILDLGVMISAEAMPMISDVMWE
jgi:hypothetical protein